MKVKYAFIDKETSNKFLPIVTKYQREAKAKLLLFVIANVGVIAVTSYASSLALKFIKECKKEKIQHIDLDSYAKDMMNDIIAWYVMLSTSFKNARVEAQNKVSDYNVLPSVKTALKQEVKKPVIIDKDNVENNYYGAYGQIEGYEYRKELQQYVEDLSNNEFKSVEGRSFFAQAELDLRHDIQMQTLDDIYTSIGEDNPVMKENAVVNVSKSFNEDGSINTDTLRWLSSHKDSSERCEKWQGKLVSLLLPAINDKLETGYKINGTKIYSFIAIENQEQTTKSGKRYKNNIICGFNCRHHLLKYQDKALVPEKYTKKEIERSRELNEKQRQLEREIRHLKDLLELEMKANNMKKVAIIKQTIKIKIRDYEAFCRKYDLVIERSRIK